MKTNVTFNAIANLDLDQLKRKLMHIDAGEGWSLEKVTSVEKEYRRFLCVMKAFPDQQASPLVDVDIFWHYHILDTKKYASDCQAAFGYFLHHFPYLGLRGEEDEKMLEASGNRMRDLYEQLFDEPYAHNLSAWCAVEDRKAANDAKAAWCAIQDSQPRAASAAWCAIEDRPRAANAAWCAIEDKPKAANAAWCAIEDSQPQAAKAAWCAIEDKPRAANAAWCAIEDSKPGAARTASCAFADVGQAGTTGLAANQAEFIHLDEEHGMRRANAAAR